jgi:isocitrate dehydrogenase
MRFSHKERQRVVSSSEIIKTLEEVVSNGFDIIKTENLYWFDGLPAFSSAEG